MDIAIYFEGGGNTADTKAALRQGMSAFLKPLSDEARKNRCHWKIVSCGGRDEARGAFLYQLSVAPNVFNVLLVDAEAAVVAKPREHLRRRDGWDLAAAQEDQIHLMVQTMEAWLLADPEALASYYGQRFNRSSLPRQANLEKVEKAVLYSTLETATKNTQKGEYGKIKHASELLKKINQNKVHARCPSCKLFFEKVKEKIAK